jgi:gamma-glutamylcyclotransferase
MISRHMVWYFAYGSNMNPARLVDRKVPFASRVGGRLDGWRLAFNKAARTPVGSGAGNIVIDGSACVHGTLNEVQEAGLLALDHYEGVTGGHYERRTLAVVRVDTGETVPAIAYVALKLGEGLRPTREYLGHFLAGRDLLPDDYYVRLKATPTFD